MAFLSSRSSATALALDSWFYHTNNGFTLEGRKTMQDILDLMEPVLDHNSLANLTVGDVHTQYSLADGTRAFTGVVGGITPTAGAHLVTKDYVDGIVNSISWQDPVLDVQTDNTLDPGATPTTGDRYILEDVLNLNANFGTPAGVVDDDIVEYNGSVFIVIYATSVEGVGTLQNEATNGYLNYNGVSWVSMGSVLDHGNLLGLGDDDHTQYALLLGRAGGQEIIGGTGSGDNLTLTSTSNATKGKVITSGTLDVTTKMQMGGLDLMRSTDGELPGTASLGVGKSTLSLATAGQQDNTALGFEALMSILGGVQCTAVGKSALTSNTGSYNTAVGKGASRENTTGERNSSFGKYSQRLCTIGTHNTSMGQQSLNNNVSGIHNTALGYSSGSSALGDGNVFLGYQAGSGETGSNKFYLHNSSTSTPLYYGEFDIALARVNGDFEVTGDFAVLKGISGTFNTNGILTLSSNGRTDMTATAAEVLRLNRAGSNGQILGMYNDGSQIANFAINGSGLGITFGYAGATAWTVDSNQDTAMSGQLTALAGTTAKSSITIPTGVAESSPGFGNMYADATGVFWHNGTNYKNLVNASPTGPGAPMGEFI